MAQLRDAQTSELLAEGTPVEMVALADGIGRDEVLFDGVGESFDPDAVLQAHTENAEGLEQAAGQEGDEDAKASLRKAAEAARAELEPGQGKVEKAQQRLDAARDRLS